MKPDNRGVASASRAVVAMRRTSRVLSDADVI